MPRLIYSAFLLLVLPLVPLKLLWRSIKQPAYLNHWGERFGFYTTPVKKPVIWLHCVSVGETRAAAPLINALCGQYPQHQILLTHGTPTGREASEQLFGDSVQRVYLPYDVPFAVNKFLTHFKPAMGLLLETELWFNLIAACKHKRVPLLLVNARLSEKSANGYAKLGALVSAGLGELSAIAAQTEADAARLHALGAQQVSVVGNLKFDVKPPADSLEKGLALRTLLGANIGSGRTVFLAASTREGEEALILDAVKDLDILTVIVPRHPQRFDEVAALLDARGIQYIRRSQLMSRQLNLSAKREQEGTDEEADNAIVKQESSVVLGDSMGELFTYYAACDFTFIGGSLLNYGGQNLIEAASLGKPVLIGPHTFNFAEATQAAIAAGAAMRVEDTIELREKILLLQQNLATQQQMREAALCYHQAAGGATARVMALMQTYILPT